MEGKEREESGKGGKEEEGKEEEERVFQRIIWTMCFRYTPCICFY